MAVQSLGSGGRNLKARVVSLAAGLAVLWLAGGSVMIWHNHRMEDLFEGVVGEDVHRLEQAEELEVELVKQKGFVSYYFISGDAKWLIMLGEHRKEFSSRLGLAKRQSANGAESDKLDRIEVEYDKYVSSKDKVIELYKTGRMEEGAELHEEVRVQFFSVLDRCAEYRTFIKTRIAARQDANRMEARRSRLATLMVVAATMVLTLVLALVIIRQVLDPIRLLADSTETEGHGPRSGDDVQDLSRQVHSLISDVGQTREELEKSRAQLFQSEKMAVVGKLAADVAHSIRNPMTSIKMRLFSLERSLDLSANQREDFEVVSEEMRRLDNIVRNFLEFSRPPKLKKQSVDPAAALDQCLDLLSHRLSMCGVEVERNLGDSVPLIEADPELFKEALVNLVVNACEAMKSGGRLVVRAQAGAAEDLGEVVIIRIEDNGPGVSSSDLDRLFEPFYSTKEDGTGLGLAIARKIVEEHGGQLVYRPREGGGACFVITLPAAEVSS